MCKASFTLSASGLGNVSFEIYTDQQFRLIAGSSEIVLLAPYFDFLSPRIAKIHAIDPTLDSLMISKSEASNSLLSEEIKNVLYILIKGGKIEIDYETSLKLRIISLILENEDLYQKIEEHFPICKDNLDPPINYILNLYQYELYSNEFKLREDECIKFISNNFYKYDKTELLKLPKTILYLILSNEGLVIQSEDFLFDFINDIFASNTNEDPEIEISSFYELIDIYFLSQEIFILFINHLKIDQINSQIWKTIQNTLTMKLSSVNQRKHSNHVHKVYCPFNGKDKFNGIIKYLSKECKGNVVDKGVVKINYARQGQIKWEKPIQSGDPREVADLDNMVKYFDSCITHNNVGINYLKYDFIDKKIKLTSYSAKSRPDWGKGGAHLMDWFIEGTNDDSNDQNWVRLDTKSNDHSIDDEGAENVFEISNKITKNDFFRFFRIGCIKNSYGNNAIVLTAFEFFGTLQTK